MYYYINYSYHTGGHMKTVKSSMVLFIGFVISCIAIISYSQEDTENLYKMRCSACHGVNGNPSGIGMKMGARAYNSAEVAAMKDADLFIIIKKGKAKMPAFSEKITDAQINELVRYIRTLK
jgi:mono/diheme cytochrome c family protein